MWNPHEIRKRLENLQNKKDTMGKLFKVFLYILNVFN